MVGIPQNHNDGDWFEKTQYSKNVHYFLEFCLVLYSVHIPVMSKMVSIYSGFSNNLLIGWDPCWLVGSLQNVSVMMLTGCFLQNVSTMTLIGWNIAECFKNHDADWLEYCRMFQQPWRSLVGILQNVSTTMTVIGWNIAGCFKHTRNCIWLEFCRIFQPWCWLVGIL